MFKQKKDYIKKKYKDVPKLNIGDVHRILQADNSDQDQFRMFNQILEIQRQEHSQTQISNTQEILQNNVQSLIETYGDTDINQEALDKIYEYVNPNADVEDQILQQEVTTMPTQQHLVESKLEQYQHYLNVLQTKLAKNVLSHYNVYLSALDNIDIIGQLSGDVVGIVKQSRDYIQEAKQSIAQVGIRILQKRNAICNIQKSIELAKQIKNQYQTQYQIYVNSINSGYVIASEYIPLLTEKLQITDELQMIPLNYINDRIEYTKQLIQSGIINQYIQYNPETYDYHYNSYLYMYKNGYLESFDTEIVGLLRQAHNQIISHVFKQIGETLQIEFYFETLADSITQIPKDQLIEFFRELCFQSLQFLFNFHLCSRHHMNELGLQEFMLELRKTIVEQVLDKINEIISMATQWKGLKKEDVVCLFGLLGIFVSKCEKFNGQNPKLFKEELHKKFVQFLTSRGIDKLIMDFIINEDCKKCLKVTLNQTQNVLQYAQRLKMHLFTYEDPFPEIVNVFKPIEFKKIIELLFGQRFDMQFKKQQNVQSIIVNGKERQILLTYTVNQIYFFMQQYLTYIIYSLNDAQYLQKEFIYIINYYIYIIGVSMLSDYYRKLIFDDCVQLNFDPKQDYENYFTQFDTASEAMIFRENYGNLIQYLKDIRIPESQEIKKVEQYELNERVVFIESIVFLIHELKEISSILPQFKAYYEQLCAIVVQLQELVIKSTIPVDLTKEFLNIRYEIKQNEKEESLRQQQVDKLISFCDIQLIGVSTQQQYEVHRILAEGVLYNVIDTYSKVKRINNLGREAMLQDYIKISRGMQHENQSYEQYIKIFNQIQQDLILNYIYEHQKQFPFRMLLSLFNSQVLQPMKKQNKKECMHKIFQQYSQ